MMRDDYVNLINQIIIGRNAYRDRQVLIDYLIDGYTYERTAERNDISRAQTVRIVEKHLPKISKYLK